MGYRELVSEPVKPSLELLRTLSDRHVVAELLEVDLLTRAEIAARAGLSKPTVSESVKRLERRGVLVDSGEVSGGRGRAGAYYTLRPDFGVGLSISVAAEGVLAERIDVRGEVAARESAAVPGKADADSIARLLRQVVTAAMSSSTVPVRAASLAMAAPVDQRTGRAVSVDHSPLPVGGLEPQEALAGLLDCPLRLDNDVNWIARAEHDGGAGRETEDFAYFYLGEGLGAALVVDGRVRRGWRGLAGEIAHACTTDTAGRSVGLIEVVHGLGLTRPGTSAVDVESLHQKLSGDGAEGKRIVTELAQALGGVVTSAASLLDSELVVLGGPWADLPGLCEQVGQRAAAHPLPVQVVRAKVVDDAVMVGLRVQVVRDLQESLVSDGH